MFSQLGRKRKKEQVKTPSVKRDIMVSKHGQSELLPSRKICVGIAQEPITGVGLSNFLIALSQNTTIHSFSLLQPVHNVYMLILSEWGVLLSALLVFGVAYTLFTRTMRKTYKYAFFCFFVLVLFVGMFDHYPYTISQTQLLIAALVGFYLAYSKKRT